MGLFDKLRHLSDRSLPLCSMIVAAAGNSSRMGGQDKLFAPLGGMPVLRRTLLAIDKSELVTEIVVAVSADNLEPVADLVAQTMLTKPVRVVLGGATRTASVFAAAAECNPAAGLIAVHDGARPLVQSADIDELIRRAHRLHAVAPAIPVKDTVKQCDETGRVVATPERSALRAVQTPQVFHAAILKAALQNALQNELAITDDCAAVERLGKAVYLVEGRADNIKITTPEDLAVAQALLQQREEAAQ